MAELDVTDDLIDERDFVRKLLLHASFWTRVRSACVVGIKFCILETPAAEKSAYLGSGRHLQKSPFGVSLVTPRYADIRKLLGYRSYSDIPTRLSQDTQISQRGYLKLRGYPKILRYLKSRYVTAVRAHRARLGPHWCMRRF